jgi:alkylation response protein AidB-like acyl-CoA dehydrogenase
MNAGMSAGDRTMGLGLQALRRIAGSELLDRVGLRGPAERLVYRATRDGARAAATAGRTFVAAQRLARPARQAKRPPADLFDLTPTDEQQMMQEAVRDFAASRIRPAAQSADADRATPREVLAGTAELGLATLGIPEELGGSLAERSAVTAVLVAEALATGDMGIAAAALAPAAVATAIGLWGDADQQATYLPALAGDDPPAAAIAILEPRPVFDPLRLETRAEPANGGYVLRGAKSLVPRGADAELFVIAADLDDRGPALFVVEAGAGGIAVESEPAMGLRAAATTRLELDSVEVPSRGLLGDADPQAYAECLHRARLAWCALAVGTAVAVLDYVVPYVNERVAFGEPVSNRQGVAFPVADIAIELEGMRLATYRAAALADQGKPFGREAALARRLCAARGMRIGSDGVGLLGGHGFVTEHPVERWYRDLRAAGLMEGALLV